MAIVLVDHYDPLSMESTWYDWWDSQGFFKPQLTADGTPAPNGVFVLPLAIPTINGPLHLGHALTFTIQDTLCRWNRMLGKTTLYVPGFDHGGISTEYVVEKRLYKRTGQTRRHLGRDTFFQVLQDWNIDCQRRLTKQLRRLGNSCDWSRTAFTMGEKATRSVTEAFCRLHENGVIYRSGRFVSWCVDLNTALSDVEVERKQLHGKTMLTVPGYDPTEKFEFGVITSIAYRIENSDETIVVATTRPEVMLAITAIAVHQNDTRYKHLHGKHACHPFTQRRIPIIADDVIVDMDFGTGAVDIAPAHDPKSYEVALRHDLQIVNIMNDDGTLNENVGDRFKGMKRFHARVAVIEALKEVGLYVGNKDHPTQITMCKKSHDVVEPLLKPQWWINCKPLASAAVKRARSGLVISPHVEAEWYEFLENMEDWCVSRQLWWGHRCPAYFVRIEGQAQDRSDGKSWVVGRNLEEATERAKILAGGATFTLEQDEDVLDTWFSSALWPFSVMGWPDNTPDLQNFYPSSVLESGCDTLFTWAARTALLGVYLTGKVPFNEIFCHGMVRDSYGQKMGKSLGNGIDPVDVIQGATLESLHAQLDDGFLDENQITKAKAGHKVDYPNGIPECGTDALRFAMCVYSGKGSNDFNLDVKRVREYRNFCNYIFNITNFALPQFKAGFVPEANAKPTGEESLLEQWIFHKLNVTALDVNKHLADRDFTAATRSAHKFWLHELCEVYIEAIKPMMNDSIPTAARKSMQQTLYTCLDHGLRLLHPFMPFVTEDLWQRLPRRPGDSTPSIMVSSYPIFNLAFVFEDAHRAFELVFAAIKAGQSLADSYKLRSEIQYAAYFHAQTDHEAALFKSQIPVIVSLIKGCKSGKVVRDRNDIPGGCTSALVSHTLAVYTLVQA